MHRRCDICVARSETTRMHKKYRMVWSFMILFLNIWIVDLRSQSGMHLTSQSRYPIHLNDVDCTSDSQTRGKKLTSSRLRSAGPYLTFFRTCIPSEVCSLFAACNGSYKAISCSVICGVQAFPYPAIFAVILDGMLFLLGDVSLVWKARELAHNN